MLSPLELENKRILTNKRKYDRFEMDDYLDMVFENYKELYNENEEQKKQIKTLTEGIQYYRSIESTMQKALVLAEKTSKETKDAAALKAEAIEKDARGRANQIVETAEAEYTRIREKCLELVQQFNHYKAQLQVAANEQLRLITSATFEVETPEIDSQADIGISQGSGMQEIGSAAYTDQTGYSEAGSYQTMEQVSEEQYGQFTQEEQPSYQTMDMTAASSQPSYQTIDLQPEPETVQSSVNSQDVTAEHGKQTIQPEQPVNTNEWHADTLEQTTVQPTQDSLQQTAPLETEAIQSVQPSSGIEYVAEKTKKANSSVYSFTSTGNTQPLPDLSQITQGTAAQVADATANTQPQPTLSQQTPAPEIPAPASIENEFSFEPISGETTILPDVKTANRDALRGKKAPMSEEERLSILSAETINLDDSIREVKEREQKPQVLDVPSRQEPQVLEIDKAAEATRAQAQAQGLDSILQNITIGKKKNTNGGDSQEDPFEFLGSVDDF